MLFWRCLNTNCTNMENTLFAKKWLLSLLNLRLQKRHKCRPRAICRQCWVNILKRLLSKAFVSFSRKISVTTPKFWQWWYRIRWVLRVCQARLKSGALFLNYSQNMIFPKKTINTKKYAFPLIKCIRRYVCNGLSIMLVLVWYKSIYYSRRYAQKWFLRFHSQWSQPLTFNLKICSPSYSWQGLCLHQIWSFYGFPISSKS